MPKPLKFHLVHRDDRDPLALDENSPGFVLQPIDTSQVRRRGQRRATANLNDDDDLASKNFSSETGSVLPKSRVKLPESVLGSQYEEISGVLSRNEFVSGEIYNAPADVQAALLGNSDVEFEELEDDFMAHAMASGSDCNSDYDSSIGDISEYDGEELIRIDSESDCESWVDVPITRPGLLGDLDEQFESMMMQYDSDEIGELNDDVTGIIDDVEDDLLDDFIKKSETKYVPGPNISREADNVIEITKFQIARQLEDEEHYNTEKDNQALEDECKPKNLDKWDCESILSTLSNVENHPNVIREPKKYVKSSILSCPIPEENQLENAAMPLDHCNLGQRRPANETSAERRSRKKTIREARQQRRCDKKQLKLTFTAKQTAKSKNDFHQLVHNSAAIKF